MSSSKPNKDIPSISECGMTVCLGFIADQGSLLLVTDLSISLLTWFPPFPTVTWFISRDFTRVQFIELQSCVWLLRSFCSMAANSQTVLLATTCITDKESVRNTTWICEEYYLMLATTCITDKNL